MKLSIAEIAVIMDTLAGSLSIVVGDNIRLFGYTSETRESVLKHITQQVSQQQVELVVAGADSADTKCDHDKK